VVNAELAHIAGASETTALFRLGGNSESVRGQRAALAELGDARDVDNAVWQRFATAEPDRAMVFRLSALATEIERVWAEADAIAASCPGTLIHSSPSRGVVRCIVPMNPTSVDILRQQFLASPTSNRIGERLPDDLWSVVAPPPAADRLSVGIKATFDPHRLLNVGILGEPA
jgi:hypothetical protein